MTERDLKLDGFTITVKALMLEQATQPGSQKISTRKPENIKEVGWVIYITNFACVSVVFSTTINSNMLFLVSFFQT